MNGTKKIIKDISQELAILKSLVEHFPSGVVLFDHDKKPIVVNTAMTKMTGLPKEGFYLSELDKLLKDQEASLDKTITTNTITITIKEVRLVGFFYDVYIFYVFDSSQKLIGGVTIFQDITERKGIEKTKTDFVSLASHQLRTPLSTINWYTEMLLAGDAGKVSDEQKKYLTEIHTGNQRMVELVNALLNASQFELGVFNIEPELTDVVVLMQSVIKEQEPQIKAKKQHIETEFAKDIPTIPVDHKLLRMVFQNLLSNAVKYTPDDGNVKIFISLDKDKNILFKVSDTGYGIPKNQQDKMFTKLFRADNVREKDTSGTGLGLYIIKLIVERFGGKIWFESEENKGTTFYITLPIEGIKKKE
jgi:PAS domain S-box-containing protein